MKSNKSYVISIIFIVIIVMTVSNSLKAEEIQPLIIKGPHDGAKDIFYSDDIDIDYAEYAKGDIEVPVGIRYVSFSGHSIKVDFKEILSSLPTSPSVIINVSFKPKLLVRGDRFIKLNLTLDLSYNLPSFNLPYSPYLRIKYQDGTVKDIRGVGNQVIIKDYTSIAPLGDAKVSLELYALGPLNTFLNIFVQINKIYISAQRSFHLAKQHIMYFSDDYKTIYHYVTLPLKYSTEGWDEVYSRILYPKVYELKEVKILSAGIQRPYSFDGWSITTQGNATVLSKKMPFGSGNIDIELYFVFTTNQSVYLVQTLTSLLAPSESWSDNDTFVLLTVNLDVKIKELSSDQYNFFYVIIDPNGKIVRTSSFPANTFKLNATSKSPLGSVLIAHDNVTLDFTYNNPGLYTIQVISKTPYNLGYNVTHFLVYNFMIHDYELNSVTNLGFKGSFNLKSNLNLSNYGIYYKGAYIMLYDDSSPPRPYSKIFSVKNDIGVTSITVKNRIDYPGTPENPNKPNFVFFIVMNNSTSPKNLLSITIKVHVFNTASVAKYELIGKELTYFGPGEVRGYSLIFSIPLLNPYIAKRLAQQYNITAKLISQETGIAYNLNFTYENNPNVVNPAIVHLERIKVWSLEILIGNNSYATDWFLYDPDGKFKGNLLYITPAEVFNASSNFTLSYSINSVIQKYSLYAIVYTNDYLSKMKELISDEVKISFIADIAPNMEVEAGQELKIPVYIKNLSNFTSIIFNLELYGGDSLLSNNTYSLLPGEEKEIVISLKMPEKKVDFFKIYSHNLKVIIGQFYVKYKEGNFIDEIRKGIVNNSAPLSYIFYAVIFIILISVIAVFFKRIYPKITHK